MTVRRTIVVRQPLGGLAATVAITLTLTGACGGGASSTVDAMPPTTTPPDAAGAVPEGGARNDGAPDDLIAPRPIVDAATDDVSPPVVDAVSDAASDSGAPIDAVVGPVSHRVLTSISDKGVMAVVGTGGQVEWQFNVLSLGGEANDAWQLPNGDVAFAYRSGARELTPARDVVWNYPAPAGTEVHSCQPLPGGHFLLGEAHDGGVGILREVDGTGQVVSSVTINQPGGFAPHNQFREVRKTPQGTYLVTYLQSNRAVEVDATGKTLRTFPCGSFVAIRLPDGNTLISCGDAHRVIEVDPADRIVWEVTEREIPGNRLGFAAGLQRLANGNTVICNWPGHSGLTAQPQAFELTRDKRLVWELNNPALGWVSNLEVLDPAATVGGTVLR